MARTLLFCTALLFIITEAQAESRNRSREQSRPAASETHSRRPPPAAQQATAAPAAQGAALGMTPAARPAAQPEPVRPRPGGILSAVTLADIGYVEGLRFANLGGRRELFVPMPQGADIVANELVLVVDDLSAHEAKRSLEVILNDRTVAAISLDGKGSVRTIRIPLGKTRPRDGFFKFSFLYSGAATPDRCIDVRYVGDSLTVRPDTAVEIDFAFAGGPDVATTVALMPRDVAVVVPRGRLEPADIATALTVARALATSGRRATFHQGFERLPELARRDDHRWKRGIVVIGSLQAAAAAYLDPPIAVVAGAAPTLGALVAVRVGGTPTLIVSDASAVRAGRLLGSPIINATRGVGAATVGDVTGLKPAARQVRFEDLGVVLSQAEVFGRADLPATIDMRALPSGSKAVRLVLDVMVAPDGTGEKAVVSAFVNDRLLGSAVAANGGPTRLDLPLVEGLVGTTTSVRVVVQRRSAAGDCRFEPQGYPAQILGSSAVVLENADTTMSDFSDLVAHWAKAIEIILPRTIADQPLGALALLSDVLAALATDTAVIKVMFVPPEAAPSPAAPFIAIGNLPPSGSTPRVRFDRGRVAVSDRAGQTVLDLGGFSSGAVAQLVSAGAQPGLWIRPLSGDGSLPAPANFKLDRGDVAFIDSAGVALALSTVRERLVRVTYPDQVSWFTVADRFRPWLIGAFWLFATVMFLLGLQRMLRRRPQSD